MPDTLIVDFGGVLTTSVLDSYTRFCDEEGIDLQTFQSLLRTAFKDQRPDDPIVAFECGRLPVSDFEARMAAILSEGLGRPMEPSGIARRMMGQVTADEAMIGVVRKVREAGRTTALLSNSWGDTDYSGLEPMFDVVVVSGREGMRKPDPAIFELTLQRLGKGGRDCVFVDDAGWNCKTAAGLGMHAIKHRTAEETIPQLEELLGLKLS